jgi:mRNA interferase MazF
MRRDEVRLVDLEPVPGSEPNKRRPAIIVSNSIANGVAARLRRGVITVVPITSNTDRVYPFKSSSRRLPPAYVSNPTAQVTPGQIPPPTTSTSWARRSRRSRSGTTGAC